MAKLGKFEWTVLDTAGNAVSGANLDIRKQGATVNGSHGAGTTTYTVNNPGALVAGNTVQLNTAFGTQATVSSVTATTVVVASTLGAADDDDRLNETVNLPTLYADSNGDETKTNPLTTNSNGYATAWVLGGYYDILVSGSGLTTTLYADYYVAAERETSNEYDAASAVAFIRDTSRTLSTAGALLEDWRNAADSKFKLGYDGSITATGSGRFVGNVSASGIYTTVPIGATVLASNAISVVYTASGTNASATADASEQTRASVTWTPTSGNTGAWIYAQAQYLQNNAAAGNGDYLELRLKVSGNTRVTKRYRFASASTPLFPAEAGFFEPTLSTATVATAAFVDIEAGTTPDFEYRGDADPARITVIELKR